MKEVIDLSRLWGKKTIIERFWEKVDRKSKNECWEWTGYYAGNKYGEMQFDKQKLYAHRLSYIIANGEIPEGYYICHKCDNPSCVNPDHLFAGTCSDNAMDMIHKGRKVIGNHKGTNNGRSKLTDFQVKEIRRMKGKKTYKEIGNLFNVSESMVMFIMQGKNWTHI